MAPNNEFEATLLRAKNDFVESLGTIKEALKPKPKKKIEYTYQEPQPGLNVGAISVDQFKHAKRMVLEREQELAELAAEFPDRAIPETHKKHHYIHGKAYDLRPFYKSHPGGADVLKMSAGLPDSTPLFESYHAFADLDMIKKKLEAYRIPEEHLAENDEVVPKEMYSFAEGGFYDVVTRRVRAQMSGGDPEEGLNKSVSKYVKADWKHFTKIGLQALVNVIFFTMAFILRLPMPVAILSGLLCGFFQMGWGFTCMHDSSHFALGRRNHWVNQRLFQIWMGWSMWNSKAWMIHHVMFHHSFTGCDELDPDCHHSMPAIRKHVDTPYHVGNKIFQTVGKTFGFVGTCIATLTLSVFTPGMYTGQAMDYMNWRLATNPEKANLWGMPKYDSIKGYNTPWWEKALYGAVVLAHIQRLNPLVSWAYAIGFSGAYACCILADHDLVESAITSHLDADAFGVSNKKLPDWGEIQVRNTTNFVNDRFDFFAQMFGGINYQIEHHLFPGMAHMNLVKIAPVVQETCKEFGIPYTTYPYIWDAWMSYCVSIRAIMDEDLKTEKDIAKVKHL